MRSVQTRDSKFNRMMSYQSYIDEAEGERALLSACHDSEVSIYLEQKKSK